MEWTINKVKEECKKAKRSFVLLESLEESEGAYATFLFVGKHQGKEVVFDAYLSTLENEYFGQIFAQAVQDVVEEHPKFKNADFEATEGEHIELMDEIADELMQDEEFDISEYVHVGEETEYGIELNAALNESNITTAIIEKFVTEYNAGTLEIDEETCYSFSIDGEESDED